MGFLPYFMYIECMKTQPILLLATFLLSFSLYAQQDYVRPNLPGKWRLPSEQPDHIVLNFSDDPATTMSATWRTDTRTKQAFGEVAIATAAPRFWRNAKRVSGTTETMDASQVKSAETKANYHSVTFTGLIPDTLYAYRVGDGEHWSEWIQFRTASEEPEPFSFLYVGDAQNNILDLWSRLIREGYRTAPDARFIIHAGDLVNDAHSELEWHEWFTAGGWIHRTLPSLPLPGNHEYEGYTELEEEQDISHISVQWHPQFTLPQNGPDSLKEQAYYVDYQGTRIVALNSIEMQEKQAEWVDQVLAENPHRWSVVTFHHPLFSASGNRDNDELRELWKPVFDKHQVDIVLQGHDHSYARGRVDPLAENVPDGVNTRDITGTVYVVSVSGGKMYDVKDNWDDYEASRDRAAENTQLFQLINIDGNTLRYEAYTAVGELYDAFELIKQDEGPNQFIELQNEAIPPFTHENTVPYRLEKSQGN